MKSNQVAYGVRVKLNENFIEKCLGDKYLIEQESVIFISEGHTYNDSKGEYVMIKGGSLTNSGYAYLDQLDLEFPIPERPINIRHKHIMDCVEYELLNANDGDKITIVVDGNKGEIWNGSKYTGKHLFK